MEHHVTRKQQLAYSMQPRRHTNLINYDHTLGAEYHQQGD